MKTLKDSKGITLLAIVLIIAIIVIIGCGAAAIILLTRQNNNQDSNQVNSVVDIPEQNNKVETVVNVIDNPVSTVEPLEFTKLYLQRGKSVGDVKIIENELENSIILSITGAATNDIDGTSLIAGKNRWYQSIDLTEYTTLEFYARKGADNGDLMIGIDKNVVKRVRFQDFPNVWTKYTIDISGYTGIHEVSLAGGYADLAGSPDSNTQYRNIRLK